MPLQLFTGRRDTPRILARTAWGWMHAMTDFENEVAVATASGNGIRPGIAEWFPE